MTRENQHVAEVTQVINDLIKAGTSYDVAQLDLIYHDSLKVIMIDMHGKVTQADKNAFKTMFQTKRDNCDPPLNTWADFNHVTADARNAHVLVTRKVKLMEEEQKLVLSIDLIHDDGRWQVTREVILVQPDA